MDYKKLFKIVNIEPKLYFFLAYIASLIFLLLQGRGLKAVLLVHIISVCLFSLFRFGLEFLYILILPVMAIFLLIQYWLIKRYLKKFQQNIPQEAVIVLAHPDWLKLESWTRPDYIKADVKSIVRYLEAKKRTFSFYPHASIEDVEEVMKNKDIKEVYFVGHGSSHIFQLGPDDIIYYCEFNHKRYTKEFVHQVHCGTPDGKSLIDYIVPEENRAECFLIRKAINAFDVEREFKKMRKDLKRE